MSKIGYLLIFASFLWPMSLVATAALWGDWLKFWVSFVVLVLSTLSSIGVLIVLNSKSGGVSFKANSVQPIDKDVLSFVISFLPAFFVNEISDEQGLLVFLVFLMLFLAALFVTRSYFTNLFILIFGWRIYSADLESAGGERVRAYLIVPSSNKLSNDIVKLVRISSTNFYVVPRMRN